jgi:hypothetical protein
MRWSIEYKKFSKMGIYGEKYSYFIYDLDFCEKCKDCILVNKLINHVDVIPIIFIIILCLVDIYNVHMKV